VTSVWGENNYAKTLVK